MQAQAAISIKFVARQDQLDSTHHPPSWILEGNCWSSCRPVGSRGFYVTACLEPVAERSSVTERLVGAIFASESLQQVNFRPKISRCPDQLPLRLRGCWNWKVGLKSESSSAFSLNHPGWSWARGQEMTGISGYINNSLHLARKYARIFVCGHYLFLEAHCEVRGTDNIMSKDKYPSL